MDLLIQNARMGPDMRDVLIQDGRFARIEPRIDPAALASPPQVLDADGLALLPSFANAHCHAAMVLFRGLGDDTPLHEWLNQVIWPMERRLTADQIYWGTLFGCQEMIRAGITAVLDMYWQTPQCLRAIYESGLRGCFCHPNILPPGPESLAALQHDLMPATERDREDDEVEQRRDRGRPDRLELHLEEAPHLLHIEGAQAPPIDAPNHRRAGWGQHVVGGQWFACHGAATSRCDPRPQGDRQ